MGQGVLELLGGVRGRRESPSLQHSQARVHSCVRWLALVGARSAACHGRDRCVCVAGCSAEKAQRCLLGDSVAL